MQYKTEQNIKKLTKLYNYFDKQTAIKIISSMSEEEKEEVLNNPKVQETILKISDLNTLKIIFKQSPKFFQEIMFKNEKVQSKLIMPNQTITQEELIKNYNKKDYTLSPESIKDLKHFLQSIKSEKIFEQIIENKFFQRIIALCYENQLTKDFFNNIDEVKLFYNIINDDEIFQTRIYRQRNIIETFNNVSSHILLPKNYEKILADPINFIKMKRWKTQKFDHVYIDEKTLSILDYKTLEEIVEFENIDDEFIYSHVKNSFDFLKFKELDYNLFFFISRPDLSINSIKAIDLYYLYLGAEHSKESDSYKEYFIEFIFDSLCDHNNKYLEESERKILQEELYKKIETRSIKKIDYQNLISSPETIKTIFYLKFGKISRNMNYIEDIPYKIIMHLNTKHINQIIKLMDLKNEDELSNIYSYAIRLYLAFGLEKSLLILQGKFGSLNFKFYENLGKLDIKDIELIKEGNKYIPKTPEHFNHFMFANNQNNHFSEMLNGKEPKLNEYWSYLFNNFKEIKERCNGTLTIKKLNIILKELSPTQDIDDIAPDNYKLCENNILNDVFLGNKTKKPKEEIYKKLLDIYERMKKRIESSIPYIKGKASNGYTYEMMKLNDPIVFTLGYKCDCCIRVGDIAHKHIEHATLCRNGRILITYDENGNIASFTPLKRNGEVLIANSIECLHKELNPKAITATKEALENIAKLSQSNKKEETPINLICIGKGAYAKPDGIPFPPDISTPTIYEKDDINYQSTDFYHTKLIIIYQNPSINLHQIKYGNPTISYKDPRNEIRKVSFKGIINNEIENALNIINAVRYANTSLENLKNFKKCGKYGINECVYNDDWYILTTIDGKIYGEYIKYDERAQIEYEITYKEISQKLEKDDKNTLTKKFK